MKKNPYFFGVGTLSINLVKIFKFGNSNRVATNNNAWATNHNMELSITPNGGRTSPAAAAAIAPIVTNTARKLRISITKNQWDYNWLLTISLLHLLIRTA